jgi:hypothetical protein
MRCDRAALGKRADAAALINRLRAMRQTGEPYSDVILRLVEIEAAQRLP